MHQKAIKKGELIQRSGELNSKIYHVHKGLLRGYSIDEKGKEHIFIFAPENWTIADNLPPEVPCDLFIDALEDSIVTVHEKDISKEHQNVKPLVKRLAVLQKRIIMLMSFSAMDRYQHFTETYPNIIQRVPQKMIASYLGITPEALSTIKRKHLKK
ncbi:Crp/Fnr family transcriptional regulator [Winogradskyella sp.]|uniref:Crp/Fnr family transcriptional regulator n=1 Tax=Winogradskyella sp. TaxID=1883156 RepID=UPI003BAAAF06